MRALIIAAAVCAGIVVGAQTPPTFRTGVDLVSVDVTVLDANRQPVRGLTAADFSVKEDGKARPIAAFTAVDLPTTKAVSTPWVVDVAPDVATNAIARDGRLVVIFIAAPIGPRMPLAKPVAMAAIDELSPGDLASVIYATRGVPQTFTSDKQRLRAVIDRPFEGLPDGDEEGRGQCLCGVCTLDAMSEIADALRDVPQRRKSLIMIAPTIPIQSASPQCSGMVKDARTRLFKALDVANLTVHAFDPSGLETLATGADTASTSRPSRDRTPLMRAHLERQGNLKVLPDRTGGRAILSTNEPARAVRAVFDESRSYYVLGFPSADLKQDGHFHSIEVKVGRKDLSIAARRGYYAPGGPLRTQALKSKDVPAPLMDAVDGLWPRTELTLDVVATAFATPGSSRATVAVIAGARAHLDAAGIGRAAAVGNVDVLAGAFTLQGRSTDYQRQTLSFLQKPDTSGARNYEVLSRLSLTRGRHELRVAIDDHVAAERGSVYAAVDVPDFARAPLSVAGPLVQIAGPADVIPAGALSDLLPIVPTTRRSFARSDHVTTFARVYQGEGPIRAVAVTARIQDVNGREIAGGSEPMPSSAFGPDRSADYTFEVPVDRLSPGDYLLTLRFARGAAATERNVRFTVR